MAQLPEAVSRAWDNRQGSFVFSTTSPDGDVNSIYVTCARKWDESKLVMADNYFNKTRDNIKAGSRGSILFLDENNESYQIKGSLEYLTAGEIYQDMKENWLKPIFKGVAAVVLNVEEVYHCAVDLKSPTGGAERLL